MTRYFVAIVLLMGLVATVLATPDVQATSLSGVFNDDDASIHEPAIEAIAAAGITRGCNPPANDRFCPNRSVTRGEMAAFLTRALGLTDLGSASFVDTSQSVFRDDIRRLAAAGITKGCNPPRNDRFCPDQSVSRGQMAAFLSRALSLPAASGRRFTDTSQSVFRDDIERLAAAGVTKGCNPPRNDQFCPERAVTRAEMATFLVRGLPDLSPVTVLLDLAEGAGCVKDDVCEVVVRTVGNRSLGIREGWYHVRSYAPGEQAAFQSPETRFVATVDGSTVPLAEAPLARQGDLDIREWSGTVTTPSSGAMTLVARWVWNGETVRTVIVTFSV